MPSSQPDETTLMYPPQPYLFCCRDQASRARARCSDAAVKPAKVGTAVAEQAVNSTQQAGEGPWSKHARVGVSMSPRLGKGSFWRCLIRTQRSGHTAAKLAGSRNSMLSRRSSLITWWRVGEWLRAQLGSRPSRRVRNDMMDGQRGGNLSGAIGEGGSACGKWKRGALGILLGRLAGDVSIQAPRPQVPRGQDPPRFPISSEMDFSLSHPPSWRPIPAHPCPHRRDPVGSRDRSFSAYRATPHRLASPPSSWEEKKADRCPCWQTESIGNIIPIKIRVKRGVPGHRKKKNKARRRTLQLQPRLRCMAGAPLAASASARSKWSGANAPRRPNPLDQSHRGCLPHGPDIAFWKRARCLRTSLPWFSHAVSPV